MSIVEPSDMKNEQVGTQKKTGMTFFGTHDQHCTTLNTVCQEKEVTTPTGPEKQKTKKLILNIELQKTCQCNTFMI